MKTRVLQVFRAGMAYYVEPVGPGSIHAKLSNLPDHVADEAIGRRILAASRAKRNRGRR